MLSSQDFTAITLLLSGTSILLVVAMVLDLMEFGTVSGWALMALSVLLLSVALLHVFETTA